MQSKILSRRDLDFLLFEWLDVESLTSRKRFEDHSRETFSAALDTAEQVATDLFAPHNKKSDSNEPHFDGDVRHHHPGSEDGARRLRRRRPAGRRPGLRIRRHAAAVGGREGGHRLVHRGQRRRPRPTSSSPSPTPTRCSSARTPRQVEQFVRPMFAGRSSARCACPSRRRARACRTSPRAPSRIRSTAPKASASTG